MLKYVDMAQAVFIEMIRDKMHEKGCQEIIPPLVTGENRIGEIETQKLSKSLSGRNRRERLVSIIISNKEIEEE